LTPRARETMERTVVVCRGGIVQSKLFERSRARAITPPAITTPCTKRVGGGRKRERERDERRQEEGERIELVLTRKHEVFE